MSRGYSATTVICLCALTFFLGCLLQQLPGLPDVSSGFQKSGSKKSISIRRRATELHSVDPHRQESLATGQRSPDDVKNLQENADNQADSASPGVKSEAETEALLPEPLQAAESGYPFYTTQPFQLLSWYPRMYLFPNFLDDERCDHVVKIAEDYLAPSGLAYRRNDNPDDSRDVRTSQGTFLTRQQDPKGVLAWVEEKIAAVTGLPVNHGEPFNLLKYQIGQHYDSHYDVFNPEEYGPQETQRIATVLMYLTDVEEGGETVFPFEGVNGMERLSYINYKGCDLGFKYKPRKGDALMFWSIHPNGTFDKHALHGGCPVKKGEKYVMTKWLRDNCHLGCR